jgi:hypothetical protein
MRLQPFAELYPDSENPHCRLLFGAGIAWGERGSTDPAGQIALWLIRHRYLQRRTQEPDGSLREHYKLSCFWFEIQVARRIYRAKLAPRRRPSFEVA